MAFRKNPMTYMVDLEPKKAKRKILAAIKKAKGNASHAAEALGVDLSTLHRYVDKLGIKDDVEELRAKAGFYPGREAVEKRRESK